MGQAVGIQMTTQGMLVAGLADVETPQGTVSPARDAGFCAGDVICAIDGRKIETSDDFLTALAQADEQRRGDGADRHARRHGGRRGAAGAVAA